mgnify:CR=1 FL=1
MDRGLKSVFHWINIGLLAPHLLAYDIETPETLRLTTPRSSVLSDQPITMSEVVIFSSAFDAFFLGFDFGRGSISDFRCVPISRCTMQYLEPEMPTKTYVCLKHGVHFEPLEKVVFNERLFFLLRFLPSTKSFPRCVHKWTESQKDARARFFD